MCKISFTNVYHGNIFRNYDGQDGYIQGKQFVVRSSKYKHHANRSNDGLKMKKYFESTQFQSSGGDFFSSLFLPYCG